MTVAFAVDEIVTVNTKFVVPELPSFCDASWIVIVGLGAMSLPSALRDVADADPCGSFQ